MGMVKPKSQSKKSQIRGVDFKKIKRKLGRKLPPPNNATNTEIKSKAIVLPEQSIAADKAGLAVNKKGLTLKELLQQTSHHNSKVRKDALVGIKDILLKHPAELQVHKFAVIEKLRERIGDDDKFVRETLYQLFKSVIFPGCKEENRGSIVSLMMVYIFNAMTHLSIDVRLMAFKFLELSVECYPPAFSLHTEKILQNYEDILRKYQFLEDKGKLKNILSGLAHCLSLLPCVGRKDHLSIKDDIPVHDVLHEFEPPGAQGPVGFSNAVPRLKDLLPILVSSFMDFMPMMHTSSQLDGISCDCMQFILQNIVLLVKFLICGIYENESDQQTFSLFRKHDSAVDMPDILSRMLKKLWDIFPLNLSHHLSGKNEDRIFILNIMVAQVYFQISDWNNSPSFLGKFLEFILSSLSAKLESRSKVFHDKHLLSFIPYIPKLVMQISCDWRYRLLQVFTEFYKNSNVESSMKLACLSAIEEMLTFERNWLDLGVNDPTFVDYQIAWIHDLPLLLILLDDKNSLGSKAVLSLLLRLGQAAPINPLISREIDSIQFNLRGFYSTRVDEVVSYGPFVRLTADIQELAICCLYYFSFIDTLLMQSLVSCCLYDGLDPCTLFRILEVMHSAFKSGHIQIADYISLHVSLLSRFQVYPEGIYPTTHFDGNSNRRTFKSVTSIVCSHLTQIGDRHLVFQMLEKMIIDRICDRLSVDNKCAFLRLLISLDSKPTRLSEQSITKISTVLPQYMIDISHNFTEDDKESTCSISGKTQDYYMLPTFFLFHKSQRLLNLVLNAMGSWVSEVSSGFGSDHLRPAIFPSARIHAIVSMLLYMYKDMKIRQILVSCKTQIDALMQSLLTLASSEEPKLNLEERHKIKSSYDLLQLFRGSNM